MLAAQAVKMGSMEFGSSPFLPFGYSVDTNQEPLFDAPEPAPGAPLLSDTDNKRLTSFFEDFNASDFNMASFGEGLNFTDVWQDLPPQLMGTATSFGPHSSLSLISDLRQDTFGEGTDFLIPDESQLMPPPPPPPLQQQHQRQQHHQQQQQRQTHQQAQRQQNRQPHLQHQLLQHQHQQQHHQHHQHHHQQQHLQHPSDFENPSADVLNAAATLLQNGSRIIPKHDNASTSRESAGPLAGPSRLRHQPLEEFREETRRGAVQGQRSDYTNWYWINELPPSRSVMTPEFQYGSDSSFGPAHSYSSEANKEAAESMQQEQLKCLDCLEPSRSAASTRPGSPIPNGHGTFTKASSRDMSELVHQRADDGEAPPRKRRKSRVQKEAKVEEAEEEEEEAPIEAKPPTRRRKTKTERQESVSSSSPKETGGAGAGTGGAGARRKSASAGVKLPRENLTDEQKRENHIKSEQKRRTLIKEGFEDICNIVPGLKDGGGLSKSAVLGMTAEWLEKLLGDNGVLTNQFTSSAH